MSFVWIDGQLRDASEPAISPFDRGLLRGEGVFETFRIYRGVPFAMRRHLERLRRSADAVGIPLPDEGTLRDAMADVVRTNELSDGRMRITVTAGVGVLAPSPPAPRATVIVSASPLSPWPDSSATVVAPWPVNERSPLAGVKSISYAENVSALRWANERGADEALLGNTSGELCEGTSSNVFVVMDGQAVTPPVASGCLDGVTRALLLELGAATEGSIQLGSLKQVEEAFLTSSTREVQPISSIDGRPLRTKGTVTENAARAIAEMVARDLDP